EQERQGTLEQRTGAKLPKPRPRALDAGGLKELDQIAPLNLDLAGRIVPHEIVERWPAEERADDTRTLNLDPELRVKVVSQGHPRAIPELDGKPGIELLAQVGQHRPR